MTRREQAFLALSGMLAPSLPGSTVLRADGVPHPIPRGAALVLLHDGACEAADPLLSPLQYEIAWMAEITIDADTAEARDAAVEAIQAALLFDPTLTGTVDWAEIGMPEGEVVAQPSPDGQGQQPPVFSLGIPLRLHYVAATPAG